MSTQTYLLNDVSSLFACPEFWVHYYGLVDEDAWNPRDRRRGRLKSALFDALAVLLSGHAIELALPHKYSLRISFGSPDDQLWLQSKNFKPQLLGWLGPSACANVFRIEEFLALVHAVTGASHGQRACDIYLLLLPFVGFDREATLAKAMKSMPGQLVSTGAFSRAEARQFALEALQLPVELMELSWTPHERFGWVANGPYSLRQRNPEMGRGINLSQFWEFIRRYQEAV
jgi:hypothetical protein